MNGDMCSDQLISRKHQCIFILSTQVRDITRVPGKIRFAESRGFLIHRHSYFCRYSPLEGEFRSHLHIFEGGISRRFGDPANRELLLLQQSQIEDVDETSLYIADLFGLSQRYIVFKHPIAKVKDAVVTDDDAVFRQLTFLECVEDDLGPDAAAVTHCNCYRFQLRLLSLWNEEDYEINENNEVNENIIFFRLFRYFRLFRNPSSERLSCSSRPPKSRST